MNRAAILLLLAACQPVPQLPRRSVVAVVSNAQAAELTIQGRASTYFPLGGDEQRLLVGQYPTGRHGPLAAIHPVVNSFRHDGIDDPNGRLLARIIIYDTLQGYPKFNAEPSDTVYWYAYPDTGDGITERSVLVSSRTQTVLLAPLRMHRELVRGREAMARFVWRDDDETVWVYCAWVYCCYVEE